LLERGKVEFQALPIGAQILVGAAGSLAVAGMVAAVPFEAAAAMGGAAVAGATAAAGTAVAIWQQQPRPVTDIEDPEELRKFTHYEGDEWVVGAYYVEHPKRSKYLISPSEFHKTIAKEHLHEIVTLLRSKLLVTHAEVMMKSRKTAGAGIKATHEGVTGEFAGTFEDSRILRMVFDYQNPVLVPLNTERPLLWKERFKIIHSAVENATSGSLQFEENVDMRFGFTADLAKMVGVEMNWLSTETLSVNVQFG
jgi:hypothetical protein